MYLVSQDKKKIVLMDKVEYSSLFKKYIITAYGTGPSSYATVGEYDTEEEVKAEMGRIIAALHNGETVYEVR